jgi:catechol 2,3-dioxygenase-like lactoylglutathione lyase family enzyme
MTSTDIRPGNIKQAVPFFGITNIEASLRFYVDGLGFAIKHRWAPDGRIRWCWLERDGVVLMLQEFWKDGRPGGAPPGKEGRNLDHFCLRVEPFDETAIHEQLARHGYASGPVEKRYGAEGEGPSIYVTDPEGNVVELKGPPAT